MAKTKVTLTNGELAAKQEALDALLKMPMREPHYHQVVRMGKQLRDEIKEIAQAFNRLVEKYGVKDTDEKSPTHGRMLVKPESPGWADFEAERNALMEAECEIEVTLATLPPTLELPPAIGAVLFDFILWPGDDEALAEAERIVKTR